MHYFIDSVIEALPSAEPTHLAICNGNLVRYYIDFAPEIRKQARKRLYRNISTYSQNLQLCMDALRVAPVSALKVVRLGHLAHLHVNQEVCDFIKEIGRQKWPGQKVYFNIIVGSYVEKQKIVFQCFPKNPTTGAVYLKVGGNNAQLEMENETEYLRDPILCNTFRNPVICGAHFRSEGYHYNIQATEEIFGGKVLPEMNEKVYNIFKSISGHRSKMAPDGTRLAFSHGDFVPWNLRKNSKEYIVFDWEYCGMRFYGFDLIHYLWQVENKLHKKSPTDAMKEALDQAAVLDSYLAAMSRDKLEEMYFCELRKQFGEVL